MCVCVCVCVCEVWCEVWVGVCKVWCVEGVIKICVQSSLLLNNKSQRDSDSKDSKYI